MLVSTLFREISKLGLIFDINLPLIFIEISTISKLFKSSYYINKVKNIKYLYIKVILY